MEINGITLDLDMDDLDVAEKARDAIDTAQKECDAEKGTTDYVDGARKVCAIVEDCFDQIFGGGTSAKLFTGPKFSQHIDAFVALGDAVRGQLEEANTRVQSLEAKYSPNRLARRAKK